MNREFRQDRILLQRRQLNELAQRGAPLYQHAHFLIAKTAQECAAEWYESAAHDNDFYNRYPSMEIFVKRKWHLYIQAARQALGKMLGGNFPDSLKKEIHEALIADRQLPRPDNARRSL